MAIQARRGLKQDFDPNKMLPAEVAVPLDTREVYMAFAPGDVQKIATYENVKELIEESAEEIIEGLTEEVNQAIETANDSAQYATTQGDYAKEKGDEAQEIKVLLEEKLANGDFVGEKGDKGDQGDKGEKGDKGDKGTDGTGIGDMLQSVYDPQGKEVDFFKYVDDKVDEIELPDNLLTVEDIIDDDTTGGSNKPASAEVVKEHGVKIKNAQDKAEEAFTQASNGKIAIKDAITGVDPSIIIPANATFQELANAIEQIETGVDTEDATATAEQILASMTAYVKGAKITGSMLNRGAISQSLPINGTYTILAGYHNGSGKVTQSITTKGAATITPSTTDQTIAANQYLTGIQTIKGDANLVPANILSGKSIFGVAGSVTAGKRYATGTATTLSTEDYIEVRTTSSGVERHYFLIINGLNFKPSVVKVSYNRYSGDELWVTISCDGVYHGGYTAVSHPNKTAYGYAPHIITVPTCSTWQGGFKIAIRQIYTCTWEAWE